MDQEQLQVMSEAEKIKANVEGRKAAEELLQLAEAEVKDSMNERFWETLRNHANQKLGEKTPQVIEPMSDESAKSFLSELIPCGKYAGRKIRDILKKDRMYLEVMATNPSSFQRSLQRFLARNEAEN